ncbi:DUF2357 domain-containing protein [Lentisphaera profundi]|uniref:DUF2357 domain-containing protein n=1 Tax=Lentisphaera profundi TaxID=1658616 RepID=A0ABY7VTL0_9BACT|nr:DUF2357 domain-containing protein [Lentisphaera profundi]WDE97533.1 DUF2357 domain-containing protein [Lentisphaera profundi]
MSSFGTIRFQTANKNLIECKIFALNDDVFDDSQALQLIEGRRYEYELPKSYRLKPQSGVIRPSRSTTNRGLIEPGIFVGLLKLTLLDKSGVELALTHVDVQSTKIDYQTEYQTMLGDITEYCTDLLVQLDSPVEQSYNPDDCNDEATLVQRLYFLKSLVGSDDFCDAVHRVISNPNTRWMEELRERPLASCSRLGRFEMRQVASARRRQHVPAGHSLQSLGSLPEVIEVRDKRDSVDTQENRFIKHALTVFSLTLEDILSKLESLQKKNESLRYPGLTEEVHSLLNYFEEVLSEGFFKEVERPQVLALSSSVLQNKEGYRQILRAWLQFDLAARLSWSGGEDVYGDDEYKGGKRDVATLYEYWGFFKLLDVVCHVFKLEKPATETFLEEGNHSLTMKLKQGKQLDIGGTFNKQGRALNIRFSFNRTFSGAKAYPHGGSWTKQMRPDYTLSLWPQGLKESKHDRGENEAEFQELISHIHFDAKYKVDFLKDAFGQSSDEEALNQEKKEQREGTYKRADLLKMHAYRDAIRRTAGAYILYPGTDDTKPMQGYHELLPGLGAFPLRPQGDDGTPAIQKFLGEVISHVSNRCSQYERKSYQTYHIHKDNSGPEVCEDIPETLEYHCEKEDKKKVERVAPASDQKPYVLVGYYQEKQEEWIQEHALYNIRDNECYSAQMAGAKYALLWNEDHGMQLHKIKSQAPRLVTKQELYEMKYPKPSAAQYYVYELDFENKVSIKLDEALIKKLERASKKPRCIALEDLLMGEVKAFNISS